jgi:hypothetical protein
MSVTFHGRRPDGHVVALDIGDAAYMNLASANARAFLLFIGLEPSDDLTGEVAIPEARRAIMRARATFDRRVGRYTRDASDTKKPGCVRVIEGGIDEDYVARRLDDFETFLDAVSLREATSICWG